MRVASNVKLAHSANAKWVGETLLLFASASEKNKQTILSSALACADTPKPEFLPNSLVSREIENLCQANGITVPDFLEAMLEYQKLIAPVDENRLAISVEAAVKLLEELHVEIERKKVELASLKQQINASKRDLNSAYRVLDSHGPGNTSLLAVINGLGLLSNAAINRLAAEQESAPEPKGAMEWLDSLPQNLFLNNTASLWHEVQQTQAINYLYELLNLPKHTERSLLVAAVGVAVFDELVGEERELPELHMALCEAQPAYQETYFEALKLYA